MRLGNAHLKDSDLERTAIAILKADSQLTADLTPVGDRQLVCQLYFLMILLVVVVVEVEEADQFECRKEQRIGFYVVQKVADATNKFRHSIRAKRMALKSEYAWVHLNAYPTNAGMAFAFFEKLRDVSAANNEVGHLHRRRQAGRIESISKADLQRTDRAPWPVNE